MESTKVTGQTRLNRYFGGFQIPDLTNHDDIRILTENGTQPAGKGHVYLGVYLGLANTGQVIFR